MLEFLNQFKGYLSGKKSYWAGGAAIIYAVLGFLLGDFDLAKSVTIAWAGAVVIFLRLGISKNA